MKYRFAVLLVILFSEWISEQLFAANEDTIKKLNQVENKILELQEDEKSLKDFIELSKDPNIIFYQVNGVTFPVEKSNLPKLVGFMVKNGFDNREAKEIIKSIDKSIKVTKKFKEALPKELNTTQQQLVDLFQQRDDLRHQFGQDYWLLKEVTINPDHIPEEQGIIDGKPTTVFKVLDKTTVQLGQKRMMGNKVAFDCTFTFKFSEIPVVVTMDKPIDIAVTGTVVGTLGEGAVAKPYIYVGNRPITYSGQGDDETCWVGEITENKQKTSNKGVYHITPADKTSSSFSISLGILSEHSLEAVRYEYQMQQ